MDSFFEGRLSDSPYVEAIWRGQAGSDYAPTCPAKRHWNLLFLKHNDRVKVSVEGPLTKPTPKTHAEGTEWLVIEFKLGTFMPVLPVENLVDGAVILPEAATKSFWLNGSAWQFPDYDNVETFVDWMVRQDLLLRDPVVEATLQDRPQDWSFRTIRRRFLRSTGLTPKAINQIERAQQAMTLLEQGVPILDTVYQAGYADQPHLTRALKRFIGQTPAQIARVSNE